MNVLIFVFSDGPPHSPGYYRYDDVQLVPKPYEGQSLYSYLDSRNYDTGAQLDKVIILFCRNRMTRSFILFTFFISYKLLYFIYFVLHP